MLKKLLALITALVMLAALAPYALANQGESTLTVYMNEDFEGEVNEDDGKYYIENWTSIDPARLVKDGDNTYYYYDSEDVYNQFGLYYYNPGGTKTAMSTPLVIDFKGKRASSDTNPYLQIRNTSGVTTFSLTRKSLNTSDWRYCRLVVYSDTNGTPAFDWYESATGWDSMTLSESNLISPSFTTTASPFNFSGIMTRYLMLDDIKIYHGGATPTATVNVTGNEGTYTANYIYSDIDGEAQGATTIQWESSVNGTDNWTAIADATEAEFTPADDFDGYIRAVVTPKSTRYPVEGTAVASESIRITPVPVSALEVYMNEDFEGEVNEDDGKYYIENWTSIDPARLVKDGDNTYYYYDSEDVYNQFGLYLYKPSGTAAAMSTPLVIDFKGKRAGNTKYIEMYLRNTKSATTLSLTRTSLNTTDWRYYRLVVYSDTNGTPAFDWYESATGWDSMTLHESYLSSPSFKTTENPFNFSGIMIRYLMLDDIKIYHGGVVPTATVNVTGNEGTYTANYTYNDIDGEAQGATTIQWESSVNGTDNWTAIAGATEAEFTPANDFDGYIRAVVTPKSTRYPVEGTAVASESIRVIAKLVIDSSTGVYMANVNLTGLEKDNLWGILAVYDGANLVEAKIKKDIVVTNGAAQFSISGDERVSGLTAPSARFFLWESGTLVPVRTFE